MRIVKEILYYLYLIAVMLGLGFLGLTAMGIKMTDVLPFVK